MWKHEGGPGTGDSGALMPRASNNFIRYFFNQNISSLGSKA